MTEGGRKKGTTNTAVRAGGRGGGGGGAAWLRGPGSLPRVMPNHQLGSAGTAPRNLNGRTVGRLQTSHRGSGETRGPEITSEMAGGREASRRGDVCVQRWQRTGSKPKADTTAIFALAQRSVTPLITGPSQES